MAFNANDESYKSRTASRGKDGQTSERIYHLNIADPEQAFWHSSVPDYGDAHPSIPTMIVEKVDVQPDPQAPGWCLVLVRYKPKDSYVRENSYGEIWEWDLRAQEKQITSCETPGRQVHYPTAFDVGAAIGVDGDDVKGVNVYRPTGSLRVTKRLTSSSGFPTDAIQKMNALQGTVNNKEWAGYAIGEVLFIGGSASPIRRLKGDGSPADEEEWRLTYNFLLAKYQSAVSITLLDTNVVSVAAKPWDYIWYRHVEETYETSPGGKKIKRTGIESVHVAQVYDYTTFEVLGLKGP